MKNFWKELPKPFTVLAPMEGVTDFCFREIISEIAKPDVLFTEFTNVEGLFSEGEKENLKLLKFSNKQKPIVAQIWGKSPENYFKAGKLITELGFDGIDINMGCPVKDVLKHGCCAALIENRNLAKEIILATIESSPLPVSIKTRIGLKNKSTEDWTGFLLFFNISALTIHGRTASQMSKGKSDWEEIKKVVDIKNKLKKDTLIIGNGDVESYKEVLEKHEKFDVDGVMIGRGIFKNLLVFNKSEKKEELTNPEKQAILKKHLALFKETYDVKDYNSMKKYFKIYINGFNGASELRNKLMTTKNIEEAYSLLDD